MLSPSDSDEESFGLLDSIDKESTPPSRKTHKPFWSFSRIKNTIKQLAAKHSYVFHSAMLFFIIVGLMMVIMWDLQRVHNISEIIHDDHSGLWEKMNDTAIKTWLTPLDLCLMKAPESVSDLRMYRSANCSKFPSFTSPSPAVQKLFCSIGSSLGKQCPSPLNKRSYFTQRLKDHRYRMPHTHLAAALKTLARKNMALFFIGDGLSKQNQDALVCELMRTDRVLVQGTISDYTIRWREEKGQPPPPPALEVRYLPLDYIGDEDGEEGDGGGFADRLNLFGGYGARRDRRRRRKLNYTNPLTNVTSPPNSKLKGMAARAGLTPLTSPGQVKKPAQPEGSNITWDMTSMTGLTKDDKKGHTLDFIQTSLAPYLASNRSLAIIANAGVWYNSRERFRKELPPLLHFLHRLSVSPLPTPNSPPHMIFYRETAAQHWNHTSHGYYEGGDGVEGACVPIQDATPELDWRNTDVENILTNDHLWYGDKDPDADGDDDKSGLRRVGGIKVIPFREVTSPLHDMHPSSASHPDCTHFCYLPQMWEPVWFALWNETRSL